MKNPSFSPKSLIFFNDSSNEAHGLWEKVKNTTAPLPKAQLLKSSLPISSLSTQVPQPNKPIVISNPKPILSPPLPKPKVKQVKLIPAPALPSGSHAHLDHKKLQRLKKGKNRPDGKLDLHGMDQETARQSLIDFVLYQQDTNHRTVLVITGKGHGILQKSVPLWLNLPPLRPHILGYDQAAPQDGGQGALYVFIKRKDKAI